MYGVKKWGNSNRIGIEKRRKECYNIHKKIIYILLMEIMMINYNKLMEKLKEKWITTYTIRQKALIPQSTLTNPNKLL